MRRRKGAEAGNGLERRPEHHVVTAKARGFGLGEQNVPMRPSHAAGKVGGRRDQAGRIGGQGAQLCARTGGTAECAPCSLALEQYGFQSWGWMAEGLPVARGGTRTPVTLQLE